MTTPAPLLQFNDVQLYYDHVHALKGVSVEVRESETVALIGANGAGKSSILRAITGLRTIQRGEILFNGAPIHTRPPHEIVQMGIAMVPEGRRVFPYMSVKDNLLLGGFTRADKKQIGDTRDRVLARFPRLRERYGQAAGTLSGGEQQMLVIGRALMARPRLLLLDEPSLGLAPKLVQDIAQSVIAINEDEQVSVLLVEQNSRLALRISHRAYALSTGQVALSGDSHELAEDPRIQKVYLGAEI